jgi:hypothetical protein
MGNADPIDPGGLDPWRIGDLRFVAFPSSPLPVNVQAQWKQWDQVVGAKPEMASDDGTIQRGQYAPGGTLTRTYRQADGAIQWVLEGAPVQDKPLSILLAPQVLASFRELVSHLLANCPPIRRLAFGGLFYLLVKDRAQAYEVLERHLHLGLKYSEDEGDFLYQYNRRRQSQTAPGVVVNRLSRWTWVPLGEVRIVDGNLVPPPESACRLELDINTVPEFQGTIPSDRCVPLFDEMIGMAIEIAAKGDVR